MTTTALVIATRDRPEMLVQTLESAIRQTVPSIVVSSSSSDQQRNLTMSCNPSGIISGSAYVAIPPRELSSDEHTAYMQEHLLGDEDYAVLFHDDDLMEPTYHAALRQVLDENEDVVAASCNARTLLGQTLTDRRTMGAWSGRTEIGSPAELLAAYMDFR